MITLPAGRYLIGDLCYRDEDVWDQMISTFGMTGTVHSSYEGTDHTFVILNTKWGDGTYADNNENVYHVDSGTIGIMSWDKGTAYNSPVARVYDFPESFQVYKEKGKLHFGNIVIDTDPEPVEQVDSESPYINEDDDE